jgi:hypothetical protein
MRNNQCLCGFAQFAYRAWNCLGSQKSAVSVRPPASFRVLMQLRETGNPKRLRETTVLEAYAKPARMPTVISQEVS